MDYDTANEAKATFDEVYFSPTPHAYFLEMDRHQYAIGEEAKPYFQAAVRHLQSENSDGLQPRVLDLGCSYGVGSALLKHDLGYRDISGFFANEAPLDRAECVKIASRWISDRTACPDMEFVGLDCSSPALEFAESVGLLRHGIAKNFEEGAKATEAELSKIRGCNLLFSTGAIGYVGERTLSVILGELGRAHPENVSPYVVVTVLRMFDPRPIANCFESFRYRFERVPGVRLRQRRFTDPNEQRETISLLRKRDIDTEGWEDEGWLYADLYVGARRADFDPLYEAIGNTQKQETSKNEREC